MKKLLALLTLVPALLLGQAVNVQKTMDASGNLTADFAVGPGKKVTIRSGGTLLFEPGSIATLPAGTITWNSLNKTGSSLADLSVRSASDLTSGTLPDGRFPSILPSVSGALLTGLNANELASGKVPLGRLYTTALGYGITNGAALDALAARSTTGTGDIVGAVSPTLVTPNLGTPSVLVGTNITGTALNLTVGTALNAGNLSGDVISTNNVATVVGINGTILSTLPTGILKNTTVTGVPTIAVAADFPVLNQNTTGSAAKLTTPRSVYGNVFDGSADLTQIIGSQYGGTGNGFVRFVGPSTVEKSFILPNASASILTDAAVITVAQGGTGRINSGTAYGLLAAGTTSGGVQQTLNPGLTTEVLVGGGASALPVWTTATGTGAPVRSDSPTLVTPNLGTPSTLVGTNITGTAAGLTAGTVTTNANLTGPITSTGNATAVAAQTGTGSTFVMANSPTLVTPNLGTPSTLVGTNITGTAAGLTAGSVTTNANLTGDVTSVGNTTTLASIPSGIVHVGSDTFSVMPAPATPSAGKTVVYIDSASKNLTAKHGDGTITFGVRARAPVASNWITGISVDGSTTVAQPAFSDLTGTITPAQMPAYTGDVTSPAGGTVNTLATVNTSPGTFGSVGKIPQLVVNGKGLVTSVTEVNIHAPADLITGTTLQSNVVNSSLTSLGTIANLTATNATVTGTLTVGGAVDLGGGGQVVKTTASTATSLNADSTMYAITMSNGSPSTVNLPPLAGNTGRSYRIKNIGAGTVTVDPNGTETLFNNSYITTLPLLTGQSVDIVAFPTAWIVY